MHCSSLAVRWGIEFDAGSEGSGLSRSRTVRWGIESDAGSAGSSLGVSDLWINPDTSPRLMHTPHTFTHVQSTLICHKYITRAWAIADVVASPYVILQTVQRHGCILPPS